MLYLGWSWFAQTLVAANARQSLHAQGVAEARLFVSPAPLTTLLWRVVARTQQGYYEGLDSVVANDGPVEFTFYPSEDRILAAALPHVPAAQRLQWFAGGFVGASVENDTLVLSDLRMGNHPDYVFRHAVARRGNPHWEAIEPERLPSTIPTRQLKWIWQRIWNESSVR